MAEKKFQFAAAGFAGLALCSDFPSARSARKRGFRRLHDMLDGEAEILEKLAVGCESFAYLKPRRSGNQSAICGNMISAIPNRMRIARYGSVALVMTESFSPVIP